MTEVIVAVAVVIAVVLLTVAVRRLTVTLQSLEETLEALREPPEAPPREPAPRVVGSHPVIKVMALGTGATRAARHLRNNGG